MARKTRAVAWGGDRPSPKDARAQLIAATRRRLLVDGVSAVTIAGVAREAGASRPTVYRHFRDRSDLLEATLFHAADASRSDSNLDYASIPTLQERIIAGVLYSLDVNSHDPLLKVLWESPELSRDVLAMSTSPHTIELIRSRFAAIIEIAKWHEDEISEILETFQRFTLSLIVAPGPKRSREELISYIEKRLFPAIGVPPRTD